MSVVYMLDTDICSYIMRERPPALLDRLQAATHAQHAIVISVITYYEMLLGTIGRKASPRHAALVEAFIARLSAVLPWERDAAEEAARILKALASKGRPIGGNDAMIAGHAVAADCVLLTHKVREFSRVPHLRVGDWAAGGG